jgi:hypothetical protein
VADQNEHLTNSEEGARRGLEWLGRSEDGAELAQIVGDMPTKLGDMEVAFLIAIGRAALAGHKAAPQTEAEAKARPATLSTAALPPAEVDGVLSQGEFWRRYRDSERKALLDRFWRQQHEAWNEQQHAFAPGNYMQKDWRGW